MKKAFLLLIVLLTPLLLVSQQQRFPEVNDGGSRYIEPSLPFHNVTVKNLTISGTCSGCGAGPVYGNYGYNQTGGYGWGPYTVVANCVPAAGLGNVGGGYVVDGTLNVQVAGASGTFSPKVTYTDINSGVSVIQQTSMSATSTGSSTFHFYVGCKLNTSITFEIVNASTALATYGVVAQVTKVY